MSYDRYERRRERMERKLARQAAKEANEPEPMPSVEGLSGPELDAAIRKRIEIRHKERNAFYMNLVSFVGIQLLLWTIFLTTRSPETPPWPLFVAFPWGIGLVAHGLSVYQNSLPAMERREERIQREMELEKMRLGLASDTYEKPKRDQAMRLSDDGELVPADDTAESGTKAKRGQL